MLDVCSNRANRRARQPCRRPLWRKLPLSQLESHILQVQRSAVRQHLSVAEWAMLDRMRKRAEALRKEAVAE
jgi:hypothetical protein